MSINRYSKALQTLFNLVIKNESSLVNIVKEKCSDCTTRDLKVVFIFGNQSVDLDSSIGALSWSIYENFRTFQPKNASNRILDQENFSRTIESLEDLAEFYNNTSLETLYIPLINSQDKEIVKNKIEMKYYTEKLNFDWGNYLFMPELFVPPEKSELFNVEYSFYMIDHNYPEKNTSLIDKAYQGFGDNIQVKDNVKWILDHHVIVNQYWVDTVDRKDIQVCGSANSLLLGHYKDILLKDESLLEEKSHIQNFLAKTVSSNHLEHEKAQNSIDLHLLFQSFVISQDSFMFDPVSKDTRWIEDDVKSFESLIRDKETMSSIQTWTDEFSKQKFDLKKIYTPESYKSVLLMDYKEFVYNEGKDTVGISAQTANFLAISEHIGWDVFVKDYENQLASHNLDLLLLISQFPCKENPDIFTRQLFCKMTVQQKDLLLKKLKDGGYEQDECVYLGPQTNDLLKYMAIRVSPHTLSRKLIEPMLRDIYIDFKYNTLSE